MHAEATGDAYRNTTTQRNCFTPPDDTAYTTVVVVNTAPNSGSWFPTELVHKDWELRYVALSEKRAREQGKSGFLGVIFSRHGQNHQGWW